MARKTTLSAKSLEALGPERLAQLLMEISQGQPVFKRKLRMALAASQGGETLIRSVRKRLRELGRGESYIDWHKAKAFRAEIDGLRRVIFDDVGRTHPAEGVDLLWGFLGIASTCYNRCDDSHGYLSDTFAQAREDMGILARQTKLDAQILSQRIFKSYQDNGYGQYDRLISILAPSLEDDGLDVLRGLFMAWQAELKPATNDRWDSKNFSAQIALQEIADAQGDVKAYSEQYSLEQQRRPKIAAEIAMRYLSANNPQEALQVLDGVDDLPDLAKDMLSNFRCDLSWHNARIAALEAMKEREAAQALRWEVFQASLDSTILKDYLGRMSGFDDVKAEEQALEHAVAYSQVHRALYFLISWPPEGAGHKPSKTLALDRAATLVKTRFTELDGRYYELIAPAASVLEDRHFLASCLLHRTQIDFALNNGRSSRYKHAARHLMACVSLDDAIDDYGLHTPHKDYLEDLRKRHGRKTSFWAHFEGD